MFWKKKKDEDEPKKLGFKMPDEPRKAFRIAPPPDEPINVAIGGKSMAVIDISAGGLALNYTGGLQTGTTYETRFVLPHKYVEVVVKLKVLRTDEQTAKCFTNFEDLTPELEDEIHSYILYRQKEELKQRKNPYS